MLSFFAAHPRIFLTLHLAAVAVGMGGATVADMLFFMFLKDFRISRKEAEVLRRLSDVIVAALGVLFLSGVALYLSDPARFAASPAFLSKAAIVLVLIVNGLLMHKLVAPHMVRFSFRGAPKDRSKMRRLRALSFAMGAVSFVSWYSVFLIAMLKQYLPAAAGVPHILSVYGLAVLVGVLCSQLVHRALVHRASLEG